jgi:acyl-CoA dehydrogenase
MDFQLPTAVRQVRARARKFVEEALRPLEGALPHGGAGLPPAVAADLQVRRRAQGWWHLSVPRAEGGPGLTWLEQAVVQEQWHGSTLGLLPLGLFATGEPPAPLYAATAAQRARYLQPCLDGGRLEQVVLPPWRPGRDRGLRVRRVPGGALLTGTWPAAPAWAAAHPLVVVAGGFDHCPDDAPAFLCPPDLHGMVVARRRGTMGALELVDIRWEDCFVPDDAIVPAVGAAARRWEAHRWAVVLAAGAVGAAERCLRDAIAWARTRHTFGRPLADRQAIQWAVADSARELHAARLLVYRAASRADAGADPGTAAAAAKVYATGRACQVLDRVVQIFGGAGYCADLPYERYWRELQAYRVLGGTDAELLAVMGTGAGGGG